MMGNSNGERRGRLRYASHSWLLAPPPHSSHRHGRSMKSIILFLVTTQLTLFATLSSAAFCSRGGGSGGASRSSVLLRNDLSLNKMQLCSKKISFAERGAIIMTRYRALQPFVLLMSSRSADTMNYQPRGCAAVPYQKKKVAIFGGGGYMGATTFGLLQRASSLYGTGISGVSSSPRSMCATAIGSMTMNKVLSKHFLLGYAGENLVRLVNMNNTMDIVNKINGMDAIILGTVYELEKRPVTGNTYEQTPNDKTYEFYLDRKSSRSINTGEDTWRGDDDEDISNDTHLTLFQNTIQACKMANIQHVVVIETPKTINSHAFAKILAEGGVPFTYVRVCGNMVNTPDYTYQKGIQDDLDIEGTVVGVDWIDSIVDMSKDGAEPVRREDVAALTVQCLMSLDWETSRCLEVRTRGSLADSVPLKGSVRFDQEWCVNSQVLAAKLVSVP